MIIQEIDNSINNENLKCKDSNLHLLFTKRDEKTDTIFLAATLIILVMISNLIYVFVFDSQFIITIFDPIRLMQFACIMVFIMTTPIFFILSDQNIQATAITLCALLASKNQNRKIFMKVLLIVISLTSIATLLNGLIAYQDVQSTIFFNCNILISLLRASMIVQVLLFFSSLIITSENKKLICLHFIMSICYTIAMIIIGFWIEYILQNRLHTSPKYTFWPYGLLATEIFLVVLFLFLLAIRYYCCDKNILLNIIILFIRSMILCLIIINILLQCIRINYRIYPHSNL